MTKLNGMDKKLQELEDNANDGDGYEMEFMRKFEEMEIFNQEQ